MRQVDKSEASGGQVENEGAIWNTVIKKLQFTIYIYITILYLLMFIFILNALFYALDYIYIHVLWALLKEPETNDFAGIDKWQIKNLETWRGGNVAETRSHSNSSYTDVFSDTSESLFWSQ